MRRFAIASPGLALSGLMAVALFFSVSGSAHAVAAVDPPAAAPADPGPGPGPGPSNGPAAGPEGGERYDNSARRAAPAGMVSRDAVCSGGKFADCSGG